jgi:hypothetical protein
MVHEQVFQAAVTILQHSTLHHDRSSIITFSEAVDQVLLLASGQAKRMYLSALERLLPIV